MVEGQSTLAEKPGSAAASRPAREFGVNIIGFTSASLGLGVAARATISALVAAGVPVATIDASPNGRAGADRTWAHLNIRNAESLPHPVTLMIVNPGNGHAEGIWQNFPRWFADGFNCVVPFFELPNVPDKWLPHLTAYDAVLAATQHIAGAIRNVVAVPVRTFPVAPDASNFHEVARAEFGIPEDSFAFAATWDMNSGLNRKNGIGVMRAFRAALELGIDATLVVSTTGTATHPQLIRELNVMPTGRVIIVDQYLEYPRLLGLYAACDAFVSLHRAEGLGLGMMEAMLLGKPVIATAWSGNMDFMDETSAALVPFTLTPVRDDHPAYTPANFSTPQFWAEPDILHAARAMVRVATDDAYREAIASVGQEQLVRYRAMWRAIAPQQLIDLYAAYSGEEVKLDA